MYPYEAMILVDPVMHGADPEGVESTVKGLLEKHGAKIHDFEKWDERKLAYEIKGHRRATYMLCFFNAPSEAIDPIRRECVLNTLVIRVMILARDEETNVDEELGGRGEPAEAAAAPAPATPPAKES